jgi:tRNA(Ile)-lysidine synthase
VPNAHREPASDPLPLSRRDVAPIVASWRALTGGARVRDQNRRTLVALSAGADSSALLLALAVGAGAHRSAIVAGHVIHDLRSRRAVLADARAARQLAERLGVTFAQAEVHVKALPGNAEDHARRARLRALTDLALAHGCGFIATAHHATDQLETVLLRLIRGAGPRALGGIAPSRVVRREPRVRLIRPLLAVPRAELEALCLRAGVRWRTDPTNADLSRARALLRAKVLPVLRTIAPHADAHASASAQRIRRTGLALDRLASQIAFRRSGGTVSTLRAPLAAWPAIVLGAFLRQRVGSAPGSRRVTSRAISAAVRAIRDEVGGTRTLRLGPATVRITRDTVTITLPSGNHA